LESNKSGDGRLKRDIIGIIIMIMMKNYPRLVAFDAIIKRCLGIAKYCCVKESSKLF
jgi:hypothetical protein